MNEISFFKQFEEGDVDWAKVISIINDGLDPNAKDAFSVMDTVLYHMSDDIDDIEETKVVSEVALLLVKKGAKINAMSTKEHLLSSHTPLDVLKKIHGLTKFNIPKNALSMFLNTGPQAQHQLGVIKFLETTGFSFTPENMGRGLADAFPNYQLGIGARGEGKHILENIIPAFRYLLDKGADINIKSADKDGHTLLMRAAMNFCPEVCEFLIKEGADVNTQSNKGYTALMFASGQIDRNCVWENFDECLKCVEILINNGADKEIKSNNNRTAFSYAKSSGCKRSMDLLR